METVSQIHVRTISTVSQQVSKDNFCFEIVQDIFPFFDIYELSLQSYSSLHIYCTTMTGQAYIWCNISVKRDLSDS